MTTHARRVNTLAASAFVFLCALSIPFSLLPQIQEQHGLRPADLGLIGGSAFVAGLLAQLGLARFVDRGYARQLFIASAVTLAIGLVWLGLATVLWQLIGARFLTGLAYAMFAPAARAAVAADDTAHMGTNLGKLSAGELAGLVIGPVLGSVLFEWRGLATPFLSLAVVAGLLLIPLSRLDLRHLDRTPETVQTPVFELLRRRPVLRAALLQLALFLPVGTYDVLWARYLRDLGASPIFVGISFAAYGLPYVLVALGGSRLIDRFGPLVVAFGGLIVTIPTVILYGVLNRPGHMLGVSLVEGVANALGAPAALAAMAAACKKSEVGTGQGIGAAMGTAAAGVTAFTMAPLYEQAGAFVTFGVTAAAMGLVGLAAAALRPKLTPSLSPSQG